MATALTSRDLECPVCTEEFTSPKILHCGHTFCLKPCLERLGRDNDAILCPECREQHALPPGGVSGFPTNVFVVRFLEQKLKQQRAKSASKKICPVCSIERQLTPCVHCERFICERCRDEHSAEMKETLLASLASLKASVDGMDLDGQYRKWQETRDRVTSEFHAELDETVKTLTRAVEDRIGEIRRDFDENDVGLIKTKLEEANRYCETTPSRVEGAVTQDELMDIQTDYQSYKDHLGRFEELVTSVPEVTTDLDCGRLLNDIKVFGENKEENAEKDVVQGLATAPIESVSHRKNIAETKTVSALRESDTSLYISQLYCVGISASSVMGKITIASHKRYDGIFDLDDDPEPLRLISVRAHGTVVGVKTVQSFADFVDMAVNTRGTVYVLTKSHIHSFNEASDNKGPDNVVEFRGGQSLASDSHGNIHVCAGKEGVVVFDAKLMQITTYGHKFQISASKIAVLGDKIYVTRTTQPQKRSRGALAMGKMFVLSLNFELLRVADVPCHNTMMVIESKYLMFGDFVNNEIRILDENLKLLREIPISGCECSRLKDLTFTPEGEILGLGDKRLYYYF